MGGREERRSQGKRDQMAYCLVGTIRTLDFTLSRIRVFGSLEYMIQLETFYGSYHLPG